MSVSVTRRSGVLRAEFRYGDVDEIACAIDLNTESVFVVCDELPPIGTSIDLELSLPHAIAPVVVRSVVSELQPGAGPGIPSGFVATFAGAEEHQRESVRGVVRRLLEPPQGAPRRRELRVLLVEDNRLVRDMFEYSLDNFFAGRTTGRVKLDLAYDVPAAWLKLHTRHYDLVIVDYFLPDEDGAALIGRLRREAMLATTAVVAISVGGRDVRRAALSAGADLFLQKPLVLKDLFHTLDFLLHDGGSDVGAA